MIWSLLKKSLTIFCRLKLWISNSNGGRKIEEVQILAAAVDFAGYAVEWLSKRYPAC